MNTRKQNTLGHFGNTITKNLITTDMTDEKIQPNSKSLNMLVNINGIGKSNVEFQVRVIRNFERSDKTFTSHDEAAEYYNNVVVE